MMCTSIINLFERRLQTWIGRDPETLVAQVGGCACRRAPCALRVWHRGAPRAAMWVASWRFVRPTRRQLRRCERSYRRLEGREERREAWAAQKAARQAAVSVCIQVDLPSREVGVQTDDAAPPTTGS